MKSKTYLPVGTREKNEPTLIEKGDVVKLITGEECTFNELKRTKFSGKINGKGYSIPVYFSKLPGGGGVPYIKEKLDKKDYSVKIKTANPEDFEIGQLFALDGRKETFMYAGIVTTPSGKVRVIGVNLSNGQRVKISKDFDFTKVDIDKIKKTIV